MKQHTRTLACCIVCVFLLSSCASVMPDPSTIKTEEERVRARNQCIAMYTVGGALGGALIGGLIGGDWKGAGVGAAIGGGVGFAYAWGKCLALYSTLQSQPVADYEQTAQQVKYNPSMGNVTKVQSFNLAPATASPGSNVKMDGSYYVMAPQGTKEIKVTETRVVKFFDPSKNQYVDLGQVDQEITAAPGMRKADGAFDLPKDVPEGKYRVAFRVSASGKEDVQERDLIVKKGAAWLPGDVRIASLILAK